MKVFFVTVLAVLLGVGTWLIMKEQGVVPAENRGWPTFSLESVSQVDIKNTKAAFSLIKKTDTWHLRMPGQALEAAVDKDEVKRLLDFLSQNRPLRKLAEPEKNFQGKMAVITVDGDFSIQITGEKDERGVPAVVSNMPGYFLLSSGYAELLGKDRSHYLNDTFFSAVPEKVEQVSFAERDAQWGIKRKNEIFVFTTPFDMALAKVRSEVVDLWLRELLGLRGSGVAAPPVKGRKADIVITITLMEGQKVYLWCWRPLGDEKAWAVSSSYQPFYMQVEEKKITALAKTAFDLLDRTLIDADTARVEKIYVTSHQREFTATRSAGKWQDTTGLNMIGLDMFLWRLRDLQYLEPPVEKLPDTVQGGMQIFGSTAGGESIVDIAFFADQNLPQGRCWAFLGDRAGFYQVNDQLYKDFQGLLPVKNKVKQE